MCHEIVLHFAITRALPVVVFKSALLKFCTLMHFCLLPLSHFGSLRLLGYFMMAFGGDASKEDAEAILESPIFENEPLRCFNFFFSINVSVTRIKPRIKSIELSFRLSLLKTAREWNQVDNNLQTNTRPIGAICRFMEIR